MLRTANHIVVLLVGLSIACSAGESGEGEAQPSCVPGKSDACVGPASCQGFQMCRADGSGYDTCQCRLSPPATGGATGNPTSSTGFGGSGTGVSRGGTTGAGGSGTTTASVPSFGGSSSGGTSTGDSAGGSAVTTLGGSTATGACQPIDMTSYAYPDYAPSRKLFASCTEDDVQAYFSECYVKGQCLPFQTGGAKAACGSCLAPTRSSDAEYGPVIRFGNATPLDETNMAGCIELMGEAECAKKMRRATLCEYEACAGVCPVTGGDYNALSACMARARTTSCAALEAAAVCISSQAHVTACSGSNFQSQFLALARVFCVEAH